MADENQNERRDYAKFNGVNFPQWKFGVMLKLRRKKLDQIVLGLEEIPAEVIYCDNIHTYVVEQTHQGTCRAKCTHQFHEQAHVTVKDCSLTETTQGKSIDNPTST